MAIVVTQNYFHLLTAEDGDDFSSKLITHVPSKNTPTSLPADAKKKKTNKKQLAAKPIVAHYQEKTMEEPVNDRGRPKQKVHFEVAMQDNNQQKEEQIVERKLTLKEYEKQLLEKKQALNAVWKTDVERKVGLDKDFESMKLAYKKKADDDCVLDKPKKKEISQHNKAKVDYKHKVVIDMNGFLKPQRRRESKIHPLAANGGIVKAQTETETETPISIAYAVQFPALK